MEKGELSVNAYQRKRTHAAAMVLAAALLAAPACAAALETTPLVPGAQIAACEAERMPAFGRCRGYNGVTASDKWLKQARIGGMSIDLRVHTLLGEEITFQEDLGAARAGNGSICLYLSAYSGDKDLVLQVNQKALETLARAGVTEIAVGNKTGDICGYYTVKDLDAVRAALGLAEKELLCVSGEEDPVTVVSEDGVRRMVTQ